MRYVECTSSNSIPSLRSALMNQILVTIAAILIVIKVAIRPKKRDASGQQELDPTSEKVLGRSSSMPSKEPSSES